MALDGLDDLYSPGWWIKTLGQQLNDRRVGRGFSRTSTESVAVRPGLDLIAAYLRGDPPLHDGIHNEWASEFRRYVRMGRLNIAEMAVSASANRMDVRDFRTSAADDELGDVEARNIMRANKFKVVARQVIDYMLGYGDGYTIVTPPDAVRRHSLITAESPLECITAEDPATGETLAGLKLYRDHLAGCDWAYLFLPGELYVARLTGPTSLGRKRWHLSDLWEWVDEKFDDVPGNQVAMIRYRNKDGISEIERHLDHLDRINDKLFNEWYISKLQAFRQKAVMVPDEDPDDDDLDDEDQPANPLYDDAADLAAIFSSSPDSLWRLPKDAEIWESTPVSIDSLTKSVEKELEWLAAVLTIPLTSVTPDAANGSAEGASLMREEHIYKIQSRRDHADGPLAETFAMAFLFQQDEKRADVRQIETIWGPIERYSLSEKADAASKLAGLIPDEVLWTDVMQFSPADVVDRLKPLKAKQLLFDARAARAAARPAPARAVPAPAPDPADA